MKVLGIYASPRKSGNTDQLMDKALEGARSAGAEILTIYVRKLKMRGCIECGGCDETGKCVPVDGEGLPGGNRCGVRRRHDQRIHPSQLLFKEADGVIQSVRSEGIAADELGEKRRFVGGREPGRLHLTEPDPPTAPEELPGRLAAGKPPADDGYGFFSRLHIVESIIFDDLVKSPTKS